MIIKTIEPQIPNIEKFQKKLENVLKESILQTMEKICLSFN